MKRSVTMLIACTALLLASGCGSSNKPPEGSAGATGGATGTAGASSGAGAGGEVFGEPGETTSQVSRPSGPVAEIAYRDVAISPAKTKVKMGTTIIWTNHDSVEHNVTSVSGPAHFASKNIEEGQSFQFKLTRSGTIRYECTIHPTTMKGTIEVVK
jgi:plastocyanin